MPLPTPLWSRAIQISLENVAEGAEVTAQDQESAGTAAADLIGRTAGRVRRQAVPRLAAGKEAFSRNTPSEQLNTVNLDIRT